MPLASTPAQRLARARRSLDGLSVGDAFGERFFGPPEVWIGWLEARAIAAPGPWTWTDDTAMALALVDTLAADDRVDPDAFVERLAARYWLDRYRGYGHGAHRLFEAIAYGRPWRDAAAELFGGEGSFGNGGAMRVAPLGAYFADDLDRVVDEARRSAIVTHAHPEGQAGAIAVAVAAAVLAAEPDPPVDRMFAEVLARTPASATRDGVVAATELLDAPALAPVVARLGNGEGISSQDTVPLCLWAVARHPRDFAAAMWTTVAALGDRDTTCAIVGGIVAASAGGAATIPSAWLTAREPLD